MEWIQRNPKKAVALSALLVLSVIMIIWGTSGGSGSPSSEPTLGPLATPTVTPSDALTVLPTPSSVPTTVEGLMEGLSPSSAGSFGKSTVGGSSKSLPRHHVTVSATSDGAMMGVGWWIPFADGKRTGADQSGSKTFRHSDTTYGDADLARVLAYGGPYSKKTSCSITVDGKVTIRKTAKGPYGEVFCQG